MWESFYDRTSQSCSGINAKLLSYNKKKHDLQSVEYKNYIHRDVLCVLDPNPMKKHKSQKSKKGVPSASKRINNTGVLSAYVYHKVREEAADTKKRPVSSSCGKCETPSEVNAGAEKICEILPKSSIPRPRSSSNYSKTPTTELSSESPNKQASNELENSEKIKSKSSCRPICQFSKKPLSTLGNDGASLICVETLQIQPKLCTIKTCLRRERSRLVKLYESTTEKIKIYKFGEKGSGTRSKSGDSQDFYALRDECLANGTLFEDPEFPCNDSSLFFSQRPDRNYEWKRPNEICNDPKFFVEGFSRFDVQQGILGDCWLLAATANLTLNSRLFFQIVPDDQEFDDKYAGIFHFRFWQYGKWIDIVIDDRLPTYRGELVFLHSAEDNEFWSALLEKAYAKLNGSYETLKGGSTCEAMEDFTGGVSEMYEMESSPPNLFQIMVKAYERSSLMACSIEPDPRVLEAHTPQGLIRGHAYSITRIKYVEIHTPNVSGKIPLLRLRNPWGNEDEWNGAWSDEAPEWRYISQEEKEELGLTFDKDGEFWISFKDFMKYFSRLEICNLNPDSLSENELHETHKKKWEMSVFEGEWVRGVTAGGCRNFLDSFWHNPQYRVTLTDVDDDDDENKCTIIVALMQKNRRALRQSGAELLTVGFAIYHLKYPDRLPKPLDINFFKYNASVARSPSFVNLREVSCRFKLPPGTYCIVPSTFDPNEEGEFILRIFTEKQNVMEEHDEEVGYGEVDSKVAAPPTEEEKQEFSQVYQFFLKLAGEDKEVDWMELKDILDYSLKSELKLQGFSKDICRSMVAMLDADRSGKLGFQEFKELWGAIRQWKNVWLMYDTDKSGTFSGFELRDALNSAGFRLNNKVLNILMHRYGNKNGEMEFEDFMMCAIKLKSMMDHFKKKQQSGSNNATFSIDEWLESTLYS
ncbi:calpain-B isoform X2 [Diabrotica virgifera virgifera]|uniref:Calpain-A-like n=1 Tax=Diabrotica virgifera virgifera TaxID=50390 RepID=A0ABM5KET0_DIAVI|nr:calpain-B isoform X2 [Diabrotica virgifera virgifera]